MVRKEMTRLKNRVYLSKSRVFRGSLAAVKEVWPQDNTEERGLGDWRHGDSQHLLMPRGIQQSAMGVAQTDTNTPSELFGVPLSEAFDKARLLVPLVPSSLLARGWEGRGTF